MRNVTAIQIGEAAQGESNAERLAATASGFEHIRAGGDATGSEIHGLGCAHVGVGPPGTGVGIARTPGDQGGVGQQEGSKQLAGSVPTHTFALPVNHSAGRKNQARQWVVHARGPAH